MEENVVEENTIGVSVSETSVSDFEAPGSLLKENVLFVSLPRTIKEFRLKRKVKKKQKSRISGKRGIHGSSATR